MPKEIDVLAFDIGFALKRELPSRALTTFFRRMPEQDFDDMCRRVADHLRRSNWVQQPPTFQGFAYLMPKRNEPPPHE